MKVGFGSASITPKGGKIIIAGGIPVRFTDVVHDDVRAVAMVIEQDDTRTIWVGCDMCHPTKKLTDTVIDSLKKHIADFNADEFIMTATHTTAYFYLTDDEFLNSFDVDLTPVIPLEESRNQVCEGVTKAVLEALSNMDDCSVEFAASDIITGLCRRVVYKDGSAEIYRDVHSDEFLRMEYPDGTGVQLLYFYNKRNRQLAGIFAAVPCPAQADETSVYITADYWATVRERIAEEFGSNVNVLGVCRAAGELSPHRFIKIDAGISGGGWGCAAAQKLGLHIADAIIKEKNRPICVFDSENIPHSRITTEISFPIRKPSEDEIQMANQYFENSKENTGECNLQEKAAATHILKVINAGDFYKSRVSVMKIADLLFFTCPAELYTEYAKRISTRFPDNPVFDIQLANDSLGYLPTKEAIERGGYSTKLISTVTPPEGGDLFVDETVNLLKQL
ncbi:MAG: hypothetical protein IKC41_00790 [Clostridia bacterium]|nr:hypothetical protein [Clostridia bacterium]